MHRFVGSEKNSTPAWQPGRSCRARVRRRTPWHRVAVGLVLLAISSGCPRWARAPKAGVALLRPAVAAADSVTLEVFFVRFPFGDAELNGAAWNEIDEQSIPVAVRQRLAKNGLRAGLAAADLPASMARLLKLQDKRPLREDGLQTVDLQHESTVSQRLLQLRDGQPGYIAKSEVRDNLPLLWYRGGQLQGRAFSKAQCLFAVTTARRGDGHVRLDLVPELHYGEARQKYSGEYGVFRVQFTRPKEIFTDLGIQVDLAPGQMLVVGGLPRRSGSVGWHFFSCPSTRGQDQKLLVVRLLHAAATAGPFAVEDRLPPAEIVSTGLRGPPPSQ